MQYDQFVGQVQHRAQLADSGQAVGAIRATLQTLGERLFGGEAKELAAQLPREIGYYLQQSGLKDKFDLDEFCVRVSEREGVDYPTAIRHSRVVLSVLMDAVSAGEIDDARAQLPDDLKWLLEPEYVPRTTNKYTQAKMKYPA